MSASGGSGDGESGSWPEVGVLASPATSDALEAWLFEAGALAVTVHDAREDDDIAHAVLEPAPGEVRLWERLTLVGLFAQGTDDGALAAALARAADACGLTAPGPSAAGLAGPPEYRVSRLADTVWERAWMAGFGPMRFGPRFGLRPSHLEPATDEGVTLVLDPGLAFGSGTHATTAQCLEWLGRDTGHTLEPFAGRRVIDYGCGSGVLAIAAALLGAETVHAVDIDPQALVATRANAAANGVAARLRITPPGALAETIEAAAPGTGADLLLANILYGPLEALADTFAALLRAGGTLLLSGLLEGQIEPLRLRYNRAFEFAPGRSRDGWALLEATRRPNA